MQILEALPRLEPGDELLPCINIMLDNAIEGDKAMDLPDLKKRLRRRRM